MRLSRIMRSISLNRGLTKEEHQSRRQVLHRLSELMINGYWECPDCNSINEWGEGEQGQPNFCLSCKSVRIRYVPGVQ